MVWSLRIIGPNSNHVAHILGIRPKYIVYLYIRVYNMFRHLIWKVLNTLFKKMYCGWYLGTSEVEKIRSLKRTIRTLDGGFCGFKIFRICREDECGGGGVLEVVPRQEPEQTSRSLLDIIGTLLSTVADKLLRHTLELTDLPIALHFPFKCKLHFHIFCVMFVSCHISYWYVLKIDMTYLGDQYLCTQKLIVPSENSPRTSGTICLS